LGISHSAHRGNPGSSGIFRSKIVKTFNAHGGQASREFD
jgi:hypothetical protein